MLKEIIVNQEPTTEVLAETSIQNNGKVQVKRETMRRGARLLERFHFTRLHFNVVNGEWVQRGTFYITRKQLTDLLDPLCDVVDSDETGASDATV